MQTEVENISFEQLVTLAKQLPEQQWAELKQEVEHQKDKQKERASFKELLLNGPIFSKKQLESINHTRKKIDQWREK